MTDILQDITAHFQKRADQSKVASVDQEFTPIQRQSRTVAGEIFSHVCFWVEQWRQGLIDKVRDVALDPIRALDEVEAPMMCRREEGGCGGGAFSVFKGARCQPFVLLQCTECGAVYSITSLNMEEV